MAYKAIWKGTLRYAAIALPVTLVKATNDPDDGLQANLLHKACGTRHQQKKWCPACEQTLETADLIKGYPVSKDTYVQFTEDELTALEPPASKTIELISACPEAEIDQTYLRGHYYLAPESIGVGASFAIWREATRGLYLIGRWLLRNREHLVAIRAKDDGLVLHQLYEGRDVRSLLEFGPLDAARRVETPTKHVEMAKAVFATLLEPFNPSLASDRYRDNLLAAIHAKAAGLAPALPAAEPEATPAPDLLAALQASLDLVKSRSTPRALPAAEPEPATDREKRGRWGGKSKKAA